MKREIIVTADSWKRIPKFMRPMMLSAAALLTFDYSSEEWAEIAKSLGSLNAKQEAIEKARVQLRNSARSHFLRNLNAPGQVTEKKWRLRHWLKVVGLSGALLSEFYWLEKDERKNGPANLDDAKCDAYNEVSLVLMAIKVTAESRVVSLNGKSDAIHPKTTSKARYQSDVLEVWTDLGGKLKFSRHPNTKKIGGPLVRYYSAATKPVHGGSPESLRDAIKRYKAQKAVPKKQRRERVVAEALP